VATPFDNSLRYPTRSNLQGLVDSLPEPERVYRRRINRLAPRRFLESLGEEAIFDIHFLFVSNNPTTTMGDQCNPCNFTNIQGYPHPLPDKAIEKLPIFQETMLLVPSLTSENSVCAPVDGAMLITMKTPR
jgi:hypothetical protein